MMQLEISNNLGESLMLDFPNDLSEISLAKNVAFDICDADIVEWLKERAERKDFSDSIYYTYLICRAVSCFVEVDLNELMDYQIGDLHDENGELKPNVLEKHIESYNKEVSIDNEAIKSIALQLYGKIQSVKSKYKFEYKTKENYLFEHKGKKFKIPYLVSNLLGVKKFSPMTTKQGVEILQIKKYLADHMQIKTFDLEHSNNIANQVFTAYLHVIGITAIPEDVSYEDFRIDDVEEKAVFFQDIDARTANDIIFFLKNSMLN